MGIDAGHGAILRLDHRHRWEMQNRWIDSRRRGDENGLERLDTRLPPEVPLVEQMQSRESGSVEMTTYRRRAKERRQHASKDLPPPISALQREKHG